MENKGQNTSDSPDESILDLHPKDLKISKEDQPDTSEAEEARDESKQISERSSKEANSEETKKAADEFNDDGKETEPVFDGTEAPELEEIRSLSSRSLEVDPEAQGPAWPEKAVALKNFVKEKGAVAVSTVLRRLSVKKDEGEEHNNDAVNNADDSKWLSWNPLSFIKISRNVESPHKSEEAESIKVEEHVEAPGMKGRITVYTRLGCKECKEVRQFMHHKRLRYVEINIDIYPSRKLELEKNTGSWTIPCVFFNDILIGGLSELNALDESGKLSDHIDLLVDNEPSPAAPLPPLPGEDDVSGSGTIDELASIVRKMKQTIIPKDRFYKMRMFTSCFLGSEAVDFLSEDQYLEREEAVEFGRKLVAKHFFRHVLDENTFEDGSHVYRFLDDDPIVISQCYNIPRGITEVKPKPLTEIASRLRQLSLAIFEAYVSDDGKHVDYRSIYHSEEYRRYLRIIEELQRVELRDVSREEKLAFFINLYNMMAIHAVLTWGHPIGPLDRRKFLGDFKYVVGGFLYSLSGIQNGILRGNQRPPYNISKPFGPKDGRSKVALPYAEPLVHFALVCGTRSGPALRGYSPQNIDKELMDAARAFIGSGALLLDPAASLVSASKILKWFSVDFGKTEMDVIRHAANFLEPSRSEELLGVIAAGQLRVVYQPFDWGLNF